MGWVGMIGSVAMVRRVFLLFLVVLTGLALSCSEIRQPVLSVTATTTELSPGRTAQLTVTRQFPGGGPLDTVTNEVRYSVFPRDIIDVSDTGLVTPGFETGSADVRITDLKDSAATSIRFTVIAAKIVSLRMEPASLTRLKPGEARQFGAVATLSDGTESNVTTSVLWESSNASAATVGRTQGDVGNVTGVRSGETTITATAAGTNVQARNVVLVEGDPPQLAAINLSPNPAVATLNVPLPLTAIGVYTNGQTEDISHTATWFSSDPSKATVDANGIVTAVSQGAVTITAAGPAELIKGSTALTVE